MSGPGTIAILSTGDMGASLGSRLRAQHRVITSGAGRSADTLRRAREAGIEILDSLGAVAEAADLVVSVVPPPAALRSAADYHAAASEAGAKRGQLYLDANSISPSTAELISDELAGSGIDFVDGAIFGAAARLERDGRLLVSGPSAARVEVLIAGALPVRDVGPQVGRASARKMLLAGLTKGLCALVVEVGALAAELGTLEDTLGDYREHYPGMMELVDRMLPTYPRHAARRAGELMELEDLSRECGHDPLVIAAARVVTQRFAALDLPADAAGSTGAWTAKDVLAAAADIPHFGGSTSSPPASGPPRGVPDGR